MRGLDKGILLAVIALVGIGLVQVYSSSFIFAIESRGDGLFFFKRQLVFAVISVAVLLATAHTPLIWWKRFAPFIWLAAVLGVLATFIPGLGANKGGATRWLFLPGGFVVEPSEVIKVSLSLLLANYVATSWDFLKELQWPARVILLVAPLLFVLKQPDFGTFFICALVILAVLFAFGLPTRIIGYTLATAIPAFYLLVMMVPYRRARVMAFLDPWSDSTQKGFQVIQSMLSFSSGGLFGTGLGQGQGKLFFLPEAHTDFTLAVLGEEMGFIGFTVVLMIYGFLVLRGLQLVSKCEDRFAKTLALGLTLTFAISVFINVGVVLGLLPTKGLTLPFLSYGGSSLVAQGFLFGLLLNVARENDGEKSLSRRAHHGILRSQV